MNHSEIVSFLWGVADLIRDTFKRGKYQDVILPLTVLRRLDCVLADTKQKVLGKQAELKGKRLENLDPRGLELLILQPLLRHCRSIGHAANVCRSVMPVPPTRIGMGGRSPVRRHRSHRWCDRMLDHAANVCRSVLSVPAGSHWHGWTFAGLPDS